MSLENYYILQNLELNPLWDPHCLSCLKLLPNHTLECAFFRFLVCRELSYTPNNYKIVLALARKIKRQAIYRSDSEVYYCDYCLDLNYYLDKSVRLRRISPNSYSSLSNFSRKDFLHAPDCPIAYIP